MSRSAPHLHLHSFPTRRSSDLHGELLKLGILISERTVSRLLPRNRRPPSQTWKTFLDNHVDRKSTRLNSSHRCISYAVFCLKKKKEINTNKAPNLTYHL